MKRTLATSALAALLSVQSDAWQFGRGLRIKKRCPPAITPRYCDNAGNCDVVDPCSGKPYKTPPPRPAFDVVGTHGGPRDASVVDFSRRAPGLGVLEALDDDESCGMGRLPNSKTGKGEGSRMSKMATTPSAVPTTISQGDRDGPHWLMQVIPLKVW